MAGAALGQWGLDITAIIVVIGGNKGDLQWIELQIRKESYGSGKIAF